MAQLQKKINKNEVLQPLKPYVMQEKHYILSIAHFIQRQLGHPLGEVSWQGNITFKNEQTSKTDTFLSKVSINKAKKP